LTDGSGPKERAAQGPDSLRAYLRSFDPTDPQGAQALSAAYEALAEDAARFHEILLAEVDRVLQACEREPENGAPFLAASALAFFRGKSAGALETGIRMRLLPRLGMSVVQVRRLCADLLGDFMKPHDREAIDALTRLLADRDFRVRHFAFLVLEERGALPQGYRPGLADQILKRLTDWSDYL
jgi:hypothetical protein